MSTNINIKKKLAILDEGASVTTDATSIDFVGSGVSASTIDGDVTITIPGGSGNTTYYLNESVTQAPYKEFSSIVTGAVEQVVPLTVAGGVTSVIAEYQTPSGIPGTTQIPGGLWQFFLHFNAGAAGQNWIIRPTVYKRDLGGIETLLFTPDPEIVTGMSTTTTMYVCDGVFPASTILTTDRIVVRISMQNTTGVSQTVNFRTEGSQHYSVGLTTLNQVIPTGAVTSVTGTAPIVSSGGLTPAISIPQSSATVDGYLSSSDFAVFDAKVPATRNITINGTTFDLSADRTWNVGTVTSVAALTLGTTGTDVSSSVATGTTTPVITLNIPDASATARGLITVNTQTINGIKTFGSNPILPVSAYVTPVDFVGINVVGTIARITAVNARTAFGQSTTSTDGYLSSTDWNTFNGKQNAITLTTTGTSGAATLVGSTLNVPNYATSTSGIVGIANSSGVYTYYATLTLAMTAAVSGDTIELFSNITETGSVAITLKSGVKINGNGNTYTLSVNDNTHAFICNSGTVELFNLKVVRTGRANGSGGYVLNCAGGTLRAEGVLMDNTYGTCVSDGIAIYNLAAKGYVNGIQVQFNNTKHYECIGESTGTGDGIFSTYSVNCTGIAVSGSGISGNGTHLNSTGISTSGSGLSGQTFTGCIGISTTGIGVSATVEGRNCIGISTSGVGGSGIFYESTLISSSNYGVGGLGTNKIYNCYTQSTSSVATLSTDIYNSTVRCLWNNAAGHCTSTNALGAREILNSFLEVTNASAYCITGYIGSTWKYAANTYKGSTTAVNSTNIIQGITNTSDNQGNILI